MDLIQQIAKLVNDEYRVEIVAERREEGSLLIIIVSTEIDNEKLASADVLHLDRPSSVGELIYLLDRARFRMNRALEERSGRT